MSSSKILGIDPGLAAVGWGVLEKISNSKFQISNYGVIKTKAGVEEATRLRQIYDEMTELINKHTPHKIAVEDLFFGKNAKTAMRVGQAKGIILLAATQSGAQLEEYTPLQIKTAITGYGKADKQQVQRMVKQLLNLKEIPKPDHAADALAVALTAGVSKSFS